MTTVEARTDGRAERSRRTRLTVANAMLNLINSGELRPTAQQISESALVSLRTVFHHFEDMETLFAAAADIQIERLASLAAQIDDGLPFAARLGQFVEARARLLESISPVRRSAILHEPFSPIIARRLNWNRRFNRDETEHVFAAELRSIPDETRRMVAPALHAATEWPCWEALRTHEGLSFQHGSDVMSHTIRALLRKEKT
ncbi:MAG TPA: TetR/AcrR family transcriptional regulator [Dehalococcoidia bacterium]|nr:TetR/AcrR family transcriptional regulator [Dehalococcoidia bacterium]